MSAGVTSNFHISGLVHARFGVVILAQPPGHQSRHYKDAFSSVPEANSEGRTTSDPLEPNDRSEFWRHQKELRRVHRAAQA